MTATVERPPEPELLHPSDPQDEPGWRGFRSRFIRHKPAMVGVGLLVMFLAMAIVHPIRVEVGVNACPAFLRFAVQNQKPTA